MSLQNGNMSRFLHGHIVISGIIKCRSGMLIGGAEDTLQIGGIDRNVIRNPLTGEPYIPGSSLKGKLRSITEKIVSTANDGPLRANRSGGDREKKVWRHECDDFNAANTCQLCRIFGSTGRTARQNNYPGALLVRDGTLSNGEVLLQDGFIITETKMENAIDRLTSAAHPRTFERVPAGAEFAFELVYRVESFNHTGEPMNGNVPVDAERAKMDITNLLNAMDILEKDGLGGNISRGYGRVEFKVQEFQGYNTANHPKGGFKGADSKSLNFCKNQLKEIDFLKGH